MLGEKGALHKKLTLALIGSVNRLSMIPHTNRTSESLVSPLKTLVFEFLPRNHNPLIWTRYPVLGTIGCQYLPVRVSDY